MRKKGSISIRRIAGILFASVLGISQIMPYGSMMVTAAETTASEIIPESEYDLEDGTYVPGEVIVCVMPEIVSAYNDSSDSDAETSESGIEPLGAGSLLETGEDLMDVTEPVHDMIRSGDKEYIPVSDNGCDRVDADAALNDSAVIRIIQSDEYTTEEMLDMYSDFPGVIFAEPNFIRESAEIVPDEDTPEVFPVATQHPDITYLQYAYGNAANGMNVPDWNDADNVNAKGMVAVLDTGVDYTNPDLATVMWDEGDKYEDLVALGGGKYGLNSGAKHNGASSDDPMDTNGHGTHCAGIIGAAWNDFGVSGIANGAKIMAVRNTIDDKGHSYASTTIKGMNYIYTAMELGVDIVSVNCSFGGICSCKCVYLAVSKLEKAGAVVVCAAGNDSQNNDISDASSSMYTDLPGVIAVNASSVRGEVAGFSNYGLRSTDIFAPGEQIMSTYPMAQQNAIADINCSIPVTAQDGTAFYDEYEGADTSFEYTVNPVNGTTTEISDGLLRIKGTNVDQEEKDALTLETEPEKYAKHAVALTIKAPGPLPELPEGENYTFFIEASSPDRGIFAKIYVKTTDGKWDRPGYTGNLSEDFSAGVYTLGTCLNGGEPDLDDLTIRVVVYSMYDVEVIDRIDIDRIWITDKDPIPYSYLDGTSMATPAVTGEAAVMAKAFPDDSAAKRAARILAGAAFSDSLYLRCITGGMANVSNSLNEEMYTPVINSLTEDEEHKFHISGYFFGNKDDTAVTLTEGGRTWSSADGTLEILSVTAGDPDEIIISRPDGLIRGEVTVSVTDNGKAPGRRSYSRILVYEQEGSFERMPYPSEHTDLEVSAFVGLKDKLYLSGNSEKTGKCKTIAYDLNDGSWSETKFAIDDAGPSSVITWKGCLVYLKQTLDDTELHVIDPETEREEAFMLYTGDVQIAKEDYLSLYYDSENMIMLRTPRIEDSNGEWVATGETEVWKVDPYLFKAVCIGKLKGAYSCKSISHSEYEKDGQTIRKIHVIGFDELKSDGRLMDEYLTIPGEDEELTTNVVDITPESGLLVANKYTPFDACSLKTGIFLTGLFQGNEDPDTGIANIVADNFTYTWSDADGLKPGSERLYPGAVYRNRVTAYKGKVYVYGLAPGDPQNAFLCSFAADTFDAYGDESLPVTDESVKLKKFSFEKKTYTINEDEKIKPVLNMEFSEPGKTTSVIFETSNPIAARINKETGEITGMDTGTAVITAKCGNKTATCTVKVIEEDFRPIGLNKTESELQVGEIDLLQLENYYLTGKETVKWSSSDAKTVSVNKGLITAKKAGMATITATWKSGKTTETYTCAVNVKDIKIPGAQTQDKAAALSVGKSALKVNVGENVEVKTLLKGTAAAQRTLRLTSSNPGLITFAEDAESVVLKSSAMPGKTNQTSATAAVFAKKAGTAYVIAESFEGSPEDLTDSTPVNRKLVKVTVSAPAQTVLIDRDSLIRNSCWDFSDEKNLDMYVMYKGSSVAFYPTLLPEICTDAGKVKMSIKGSGVSIKNGVITAKSPSKKDKNGQMKPAVLTVKCGKAEAKLDVYVKE